MQKTASAESGIFQLRVLLTFTLFSMGAAMFGFAAVPSKNAIRAGATWPSDLVAVNKLRNQTGSASAGTITLIAPSPGWSIIGVADPATQNNSLSAVACVSGTDCWAVGSYDITGGFAPQTLIEHWDGTGWSVISSPNDTGGNHIYGGFSAITCNSSNDCWAVGHYFINGGGVIQTLVQHWNGLSWSIVSSPNTTSGDEHLLSSVTCASSSDCWAVGKDYDSVFLHSTTLIEHWNGISWSIVSSPNAGPSNYSALFSVACGSGSECWAVGYYADSNDMNKTLVELWNGSAWVIVPSPNKPSTDIRDDNLLSGVTCVSNSNCWAVGSFETGRTTLVEHWDGNAWSIVASPDSPLTVEFDGLGAVTCASASDCWATGGYQSSTTAEPFVEHWDGTSWSVVSVPNTSDRQNNYINGIACVSGSQCWIVGNYQVADQMAQTLAEKWDGQAWSIVSSQNNDSEDLRAVTCASLDNCWAVGDYYGETDGWEHALFNRWDGSSWTAITTPFENGNHFLTGVTCTSDSQCWAVGHYYDSINDNGFDHTVIENWDGSSWTIVSSPNTSSTQNNVLDAVGCASSSQCWAVGYYDSGRGIMQTLIEQWDGTSWTIVSSANTLALESNFLHGITCASASECWAVGYSADPTGRVYQTLIEQWNGTSWAIVSSANTLPAQSNFLNSITCSSPSDCWAVGYSSTGNPAQSGVEQTLIEHWNGTAWSIFSSPNTSATQNNLLSDVSCTSTAQCWAVGSYNDSSGVPQTLIEQWDGNSWAISTSPNISNVQSNLVSGVACASPSQCWAVGQYSNADGVSRMLVEEYSLTTPALLSVVSRMTHGSAGTFDIDLPLTGSSGIECRSGGGGGNYTVVFSFVNNVMDCGSAGTVGAIVSSGPAANQCTQSLTSVPNAQFIAVSLNNVIDSQNNVGAVSAPMGVLLGDVNASGRVDAADVSSVRQQTLQPITTSNFRDDINASGRIDAADVSIARQQTLTALP